MASTGTEIVEVEALRVSTAKPEYLDNEEAEAPSRLFRFTRYFLLAVTACIAIPFGSVHNGIYLPLSACVFALTALHLVSARSRIDETFAAHTTTLTTARLLGVFFAYIVLQSLFLRFSSEPHPVLGATSGILRSGPFWSGISMLAFFASTFFLARIYLVPHTSFKRTLINAILCGGAVVSLIGISHWFYDTGKLFWFFEPDNVFISERARWPFVNANHLGHFLLPIFFLFVARLGNELESVGDYQRRHQKNNRQALSHLAHSSRLQTRLIKVGFVFCFLLAVLLALVGTLSRGTWFGLSVAALAYFFLTRRRVTASNETPTEDEPRHRHTQRSSGSSKHKNAFSVEAFIMGVSRLARPTFVILAGIFLIFFFSERGRDLVSARIDYGLMYSKDDMRWQMYADTLPMIKEHPLLGVGLGGWRAEFPRAMSPLLSGVEPVYLHSEPLQLIAELGLIGFTIVCLLIFYCSIQGLKALALFKVSDHSRARTMTALLCGMWGFFAASFFDFPLRMPAIVFMLGIYLALTTAYTDSAQRSISR
ncbi:MAG: O-antigen ligase family protein [Deltaproteobacteria bacterium]|nr:O-antigen ligase family protein [Deltaproteobacteria bacterium]